MGWYGYSRRTVIQFSGHFHFCGNDANATAYCEDLIEADRRYSSFGMLALGTGVGRAVMMDNKEVLTGKHFQGGELSHVILYPYEEHCNYG